MGKRAGQARKDNTFLKSGLIRHDYDPNVGINKWLHKKKLEKKAQANPETVRTFTQWLRYVSEKTIK